MQLLTFLAAAVVAVPLSGGMATDASAQTNTAYQVGRHVAAKRGVSNRECYARVFARHAVIVEDRRGRHGWRAASTPAYNSDMRRTCGIDRLALVGRSNSQPVRHATGLHQGSSQVSPEQAGAYAFGYRAAFLSGYPDRECYARWFARRATWISMGRSWTYVIWDPAERAAGPRGECGLAR